MMEIGTSVVIDGQVHEVLEFDGSGNVRVRNDHTLETEWVDYFLVEFIDPTLSDESLLIALGELAAQDNETDERES